MMRRILPAVLVILLAAATAHAGLGDLVKKAKDKATLTVKPKNSTTGGPCTNEPVQYDDVTLELTPKVLDQVAAGLKASTAIDTERTKLLDRLTKASDEREAIWTKQGPQIEAARSKRSDVEQCYEAGYKQKLQETMQKGAAAATSDPARLQQYSERAKKYNEAVRAGDSTAIANAQREMYQDFLPSSADSAKIRQGCGVLPARMPAEDKLDALDKQISDIQTQIRAHDEKGASAGTAKSGLTSQQYVMACERTQMYCALKKQKASADKMKCSFSDAEIAALDARAAELCPLVH